MTPFDVMGWAMAAFFVAIALICTIVAVGLLYVAFRDWWKRGEVR